MNIGNGQHQNLNDIQHVTEMLDDFDKEFDTLYTVRHHNSNIHTMRHVHLSLKRQAPLYKYTTFFFENMNKIIKSLAHGTVEHPKQLISSIELFRGALFHIQTPSYPLLLLSYVKDLLDEKTKASTATSLLTPVVKYYRRYEPFFSAIPYLMNIKHYDCIIYNGVRYETIVTTKKKTNDSCVLYKKPLTNQLAIGFIACIITVNNDDNRFIVINTLKINDYFQVKFYALNGTKRTENIKNAWLCQIDENELAIIKPSDIDQKLGHRNIDNRLIHVFKYPNLKESS
ncbi:unnamed protein product [Didymodactylos carnosus]|uniref:Uncharacterized protein n=1 Tax=Didymodactylos carnosus TaxID=1234261 RepID=A0A814VIR2_9BILA|nr:unnamed protein product [Didymodactylos carnosus]CAF3953735.1 unnamed protein product [Didymodactylos carnosus]